MRRVITITLLTLALAVVAADKPPLLSAKEARKLYVTKCARCHPLYDGSTYSEQDWDAWVRKMTPKAKLNSQQQELLSQNRLSLGPPKSSRQ